MGIRFYCPNGHKLNVKSFLAGQRGVCPRCNAKLVIPFESTREKGSKDLPIAAEWEEQAKRQSQAGPLANAPQMGTAVPVNLNAIQPVKPVESSAYPTGGTSAPPTPVPVGEAVAAPAPTPFFLPQESSPTNFQLPSPSSGGGLFLGMPPKFPDPFADAPEAVWYVRVATGEQYGPVKAPVIRQWLNERRIVADTLIWREGWEEWRTGNQVFESLAGQGGPGGGWKFP